MAIKASCTVTLSCYRDTQSVTRYYKLQSSTASAPSKPTTKPPSGWSDSEPSYTSGSTNTLYFCDLTVFSDGTWSYSTVSKSSSYEAAKEAYNKAVAAGNTANSANDKIDNLEIGGRNLLDGTKDLDRYRYKILQDKIDGFSVISVEYSANSKLKDICQWFSINVEPDTDYTLSFWAKGSGLIKSYLCPDAVASGKSNKGATTTKADGCIVHTLTQEYTKYIITWRTKSNISNSKNVLPARFDVQNTDCWINIYGFKFEKGNKATDWSPAPEDQENIITSDIAPTDTSKMWFDTTSNLLKYWNSETWEVANDYANDLNDTRIEITNEYNTAIEQLKKSITLLVDELQTETSDTSQAVSRLTSQIQQNSTSISQVITETNSITNKLSGLSTKEEISKWARFYGEGADAVLELGSSNSPFAVKLSNTELGFYQNNVRIAYLSNQMLNISQAVVLSKLKFSHFEMNDIEVNGYFHLILK